jgi:WD repeat-containing protein 19
LLALGGEDRMLTITNENGDTIRQTVLRDIPKQLKFSERKQDFRSKLVEGTVSLLLKQRTLYLYSIEDPDNPIELAFQNKYGDVVIYDWYGDGYIMIGFSNGYLISISTHIKEIGQELFQLRTHKNYLSDLRISMALNKAASCGDNCVKIYELQDLKDVDSIISIDDTGNEGLKSLCWSDDGQLLAVCMSKGSVYVFLTKLPLLASVHQHNIAFMTSLKEISIYDHVSRKKVIEFE